MKTISTSSIILFLAIAFVSCQNDIDESIMDNNRIENEIVITNNKIQSPTWLMHTIDSVAQSYLPSPATNKYIYPWVYTVSHENKEYILVHDMLNSCLYCGILFFTLSGNPIQLPDELYMELVQKENRMLIWWGDHDVPKTKGATGFANVYTPNGSLVSDTYYSSEDQSSTEKANLLVQMALEYPRATVIKEATTTYNCHAYAWHMTEGGSPVWMGVLINPTNVYWMDDSYISTTQGSATKVAYLSDNHSAVPTGTPDVFISKWGTWPLMRHPKNHSPYNASSLSYLKKVVSVLGIWSVI